MNQRRDQISAGGVVLAAFFGSGCATAALAYAPRLPGPERPPRDVSAMLVVEMGKPDCAYDVIGTAFGSSLDDLRVAAAAHGGDGVYDTSCVVGIAHPTCDGRVFVCNGPKKSGTSRPSGGAVL